MADPLRFRCVAVKQHRTTFYLFSAPAKVLYGLLQINQRSTEKDEGYQRILSASRVRSVSQFVEDRHVMAPAIVITLQNATFDTRSGELVIPQREDAGWVIDGQHRLAGAREASVEVDIAVVAFLGLGLDEQIFQFVTINQTAKGVPRSLYYDLLKHLPPQKRPADVAKERAADIANQLRRSEESALFNRITVIPPQAGRTISLNNFVRKVAPLIQVDKTPISGFSLHEQSRIVDNYFMGLREHDPSLFKHSPSMVFRTLGFGALINALPALFNLTFRQHGGFRVIDVAEMFNRVQFDFETWSAIGTGNAAEHAAGNDLAEEARRRYQTESDRSGGIIRLD